MVAAVAVPVRGGAGVGDLRSRGSLWCVPVRPSRCCCRRAAALGSDALQHGHDGLEVALHGGAQVGDAGLQLLHLRVQGLDVISAGADAPRGGDPRRRAARNDALASPALAHHADGDRLHAAHSHGRRGCFGVAGGGVAGVGRGHEDAEALAVLAPGHLFKPELHLDLPLSGRDDPGVVVRLAQVQDGLVPLLHLAAALVVEHEPQRHVHAEVARVRVRDHHDQLV
mmetsp:Transcript_9415/g.36745  ORF Transcript_9415/g.36745 Transcript_9415/m.36745 type:complete len:226 (-) Transcript_9415:87-764(-)